MDEIDSKLKVLIVEDNKINQIVTKKILEKLHFKSHVTESGIEALEIVSKETFDLILMDINMPGMNGFETTIQIRQMNIETPIVALTAFSKLEIEKEASAFQHQVNPSLELTKSSDCFDPKPP